MFSITYLSLALGRIFWAGARILSSPFPGKEPKPAVAYVASCTCRCFRCIGIDGCLAAPERLCGEIREWGWLLGRGFAGISLVLIRMGRHPWRPFSFFGARDCFWELAGGHCCHTPIGGFPY